MRRIHIDAFCLFILSKYNTAEIFPEIKFVVSVMVDVTLGSVLWLTKPKNVTAGRAHRDYLRSHLDIKIRTPLCVRVRKHQKTPTHRYAFVDIQW